MENIDNIQPLPNPKTSIKKSDIKYIKYLDKLFSDDWINDYFIIKK
tara:strand:- start:498 stop:635 length:138 start_codon:yes stop_codon:yes gene_type:complete